MLQNVIDLRDRPDRWRKVRAVLAPAVDHAISDVPAYAVACDTQALPETRDAVSVAEAFRWAGGQVWPVDLYLYDEDGAPAI
ncbi:hypothetical protein ACFB49_36820 [Sphingomonas sp. DBB INV C78]|uniref:hypothetical protein n=1 Tax=Sphingomonas sp. DBB INV C78 TaxID=3349434 RepID=UPI0036D2A0EB